MIKEQILPVAVTVACTAVVLAVLWFYIRFGIISEYRTRGWKDRLPHPRLEEVEVRWGVRLPRQLEALYRAGGVAAMEEVYLAAPGPGPSPPWFVAHFIPLAVRDLAEWIKITSVPGLPVAVDDDKGTYYLPFSGLRGGSPPVLLRGPGKPGHDLKVAPSLEDFLRFLPVEVSEEGE
jgi:hypothetical protein